MVHTSCHHGALGSRHSTHTPGCKFAPCAPYLKPSMPCSPACGAIVDVVQEILAPARRLPLLDRSEDSRLLTQGTPDHGRPAICLLESGSCHYHPSILHLAHPTARSSSSSRRSTARHGLPTSATRARRTSLCDHTTSAPYKTPMSLSLL